MKISELRQAIEDYKSLNKAILSITEAQDDSVMPDPNLDYQGAEFMLDKLIIEYGYEEDRKRSIDSRAGIFLAFVGTIFLLLPTIMVKPTPDFNITSMLDVVINLLLIILYPGVFITLVYTLRKLVGAINVHDYKRLDYDSFTEENTQYSRDQIAKVIMHEYRNNVIHNKNENDIKLGKFKDGITSLQFSLTLAVAYYFVNIFLVV